MVATLAISTNTFSMRGLVRRPVYNRPLTTEHSKQTTFITDHVQQTITKLFHMTQQFQ